MQEPEGPKRTTSDPTLVLDRQAISEVAKRAIAAAIESYPDVAIHEELDVKERKTLERCPLLCHPFVGRDCLCCNGDGMVLPERAEEWRAKHPK